MVGAATVGADGAAVTDEVHLDIAAICVRMFGKIGEFGSLAMAVSAFVATHLVVAAALTPGLLAECGRRKIDGFGWDRRRAARWQCAWCR